MNKKKYEGVLYPVREARDLKDIIVKSAKEFKNETAYLEKDRPGGTFEPITYGQVKKDMDALGTKMLDMGLKGKKIAVIGETSYLWILTYFATVSGVGVIVPLDKNLPAEELKNLVKRSGASALVYSKRSEKSIEGLFEEPFDLEYFICMGSSSKDCGVLKLSDLIEEGEKLLRDGVRDYVDAEIDPDQMATLMFTSGTTGLAKGVMLSHRNIAANVHNMSKYVHLEKGWVVLSILPIHHAYEMTCVVWTTFFQGRTLAVCEGIKYIQKNLVEVKANVMVGVPLVFEKMYKGMWKQAKSRGEVEKLRKAIDLSRKMKLYNNEKMMKKLFKAIHQTFGNNIKLFIAGGAAIDPKVIEDFEAMGLPMIQGYGMSENAPIIAVNQDRYSKAASVGKPMPGTTVKIVDADEDGIGEVVCKGPSVMIGYYDNPEATAEVLRDGWLYTGDLGYMDDEGFVYLTGRKKTVIVTKGGKNIFPEEIEAVLQENELIQEVLVHGVTDKRVGNVIVTADIFPNYPLLKEKHGELNSSEIYHLFKDLINETNNTLPPYKAIKRVNIREKDFVKTTTGKIKRYGNFTEGEEHVDGGPDCQELRIAEKKHAEQVIKNINASTDHYIRYKTSRPVTDIKNMFETSAALYGDNVAFRQKFSGDEAYTEITYKQALAEVNGLGTALINRGQKDKRIGIIGETRYQWESSYLAAIGGVGVVVPLDKDLGYEELKNLIKDANISCIMYDEKFDKMLHDMKAEGDTALDVLVNFDIAEHGEDVLSWKALIEEGKNEVAGGDRQFIDAEIIAGDMAVILYTQNREKEPKGVMISNTNLVENLMAIPTILNVEARDVFFSVLPAHNIYECTCGFLMPLYKGASIAFGENPEDTPKNLKEVKPTMILAMPQLVEKAYEKIWESAKAKGKEKKLSNLLALSKKTKKLGVDVSKAFAREVKDAFGGRLHAIISAEAVADSEALDFFNDLGIIAVQGYGMAECAPMAAINPDVHKDMKKDSCGHLLPGMEVKVENPDEKGVGELCFKGGNIMLGYYNKPEETEAVLKDGWLHTGDLGFVDGENFVYITGKKKVATEANEEDTPRC